MAHIDTDSQGLSYSTGKTEISDVGLAGGTPGGSSPGSAEGPALVTLGESDTAEKGRTSILVDLTSISRPPITNVGIPSTSGGPHPKKFSAVNINKKFLEKTSSTPGPSQPSSTSTSVKSGGPAPRPTVQVATSHSRLVTAKLTAAPQSSNTTGPGWSRPPSAPSPAVPSPSSTPSINAPSAPPAAAPQLPHAGKVIQPQPRAATQSPTGGFRKENLGGPSKPVWGNVKAAVITAPKLQDDFPTAAEVAQVRKARLHESKEAAEAAAADKQARSEEADTFRGVHLDPNAHHWDEMEEDDDNFLDGVIEFGDGRQYKIQSTEAAPLKMTSPPRELPQTTQGNIRSPVEPVSKEERFADDFDRSWPRSKTSPAISYRDFPQPAHPVPSSPASSHSPLESSRVLFNERSNRLEPYSSTHSAHRQGSTHATYPPSKRGSHPEFAPSSGDSRSVRDAPPHSQGHNVQLLQKSGNSAPPSEVPRARRFSGASASTSNSFNHDRPREREFPRRDGVALPSFPTEGHDSSRTRDAFGHPAVSPGISRDREFPADQRGRRLSTNMGPPPLPTSMRDSSKDSGRQLPPHLAHMPPLQTRLSSRESHPRPPSSLHADSTSSIAPSSAHPANQSPVLSQASFAGTSVSDLPAITPGVDVDEVRKAAMHSAAERAKQRRQQEEEEREKEKERARRKATELEAKMKSQQAEKLSEKQEKPPVSQEAAVVAVIEDAVKSVGRPRSDASSLASLNQSASSLPPKPVVGRQPSLKALPQPPSDSSRPQMPNRRTSHASASGAPIIPATTAEESWRSKANPLPRPALPQLQPRPSASSSLPPILHGVEPFAVHADDEDLEIVDFSELGKLVGVVDTPVEPEAEFDHTTSRPPRPLASDFFDDSPLPHDSAPYKSDDSSWRRKPSQDHGHDHFPVSGSGTSPDETIAPSAVSQSETNSLEASARSLSDPSPLALSAKDDALSLEHSHGLSQPVVSSGSGAQRTPRNTTFNHRDAAISAFDDAMSRIKGALDGMQASEAPKGQDHVQLEDVESRATPKPKPHLPFAQVKADFPAQELKWVPPALRPKHHNFDARVSEAFDVTRSEPPQSPKPAWNTFLVRLPRLSQPLEPVNKKQLVLARSTAVPPRWDVLSWDPPVEEMRRDFSLNDVLFGRMKMHKGRLRCRVELPKSNLEGTKSIGLDASGGVGPKVNLPFSPVTKVNGVGAFGRPAVNDQATWRKPPPTTAKPSALDPIQSDGGLNTVSRSPPPDLSSNLVNVASIPALAASKDGPVTRSRSQPKMPAGSAVAFYRDSRVDTADATSKASVNFIVHSELEEPPQLSPSGIKPFITVSAPAINGVLAQSESTVSKTGRSTNVAAIPPVEELKSQTESPKFLPSLVQSKTESKISDGSADRTPVTPPSNPTNIAWTNSSLSFPVKDSPARAPDPEHLKAVWSQASDKARVHTVNSLEGIADDLTALPFTLQDVKSEDGETPPPSSGITPSRMSLHDVTRAFQQVPSSTSSSSAHRTAPLSPPSSSSLPTMRQPNFSYPLPPSNPNMRSPYAGYASPMMSHSPSPTMMYPPPMASSPVPARMAVNGHAPLYSQPVWMPLPGAAGQSPAGMMRPMPSPYPAQLIPYPSPGGPPAMYQMQPPPPPPPGNMHGQPLQQHNGGLPGRGRGISVMSPVMAHSGPAHPNLPMYSGSPVLMHTPVMQLPPGHSYMAPMPAGRGQIRPDSHPGHPAQHTGHHPPSHAPGYTPVPPNSFVRPTW